MSETDAPVQRPAGPSLTSPPPGLRAPRELLRLTELTLRQIRGIDAWTADRPQREALGAVAGVPGDEHLSASRRVEVLALAAQVVVERVALSLAGEVVPMRIPRSCRAVLAHPQPSRLQGLRLALEEWGAEVLACTDSAAEALGITVVEQPDVVLAGEGLADLDGEELLAETAPYAPYTLLVSQASASREDLTGASQLVVPAGQSDAETAHALVVAAQRRSLAGGTCGADGGAGAHPRYGLVAPRPLDFEQLTPVADAAIPAEGHVPTVRSATHRGALNVAAQAADRGAVPATSPGPELGSAERVEVVQVSGMPPPARNPA